MTSTFTQRFDITRVRRALRQSLFIACAWLLGVSLGHANGLSTSWVGTVTHVTDGDTVWVRPMSGQAPQVIRIVGIDAPEICQPFGPQAQVALSSYVLGQYVQVRGRTTDTYGRLLARLSVQGQDVGAWMVSQGLAWSYGQQRHRGSYAAYEAMARQRQSGVFSDPNAIEPRRFRKLHGSCH